MIDKEKGAEEYYSALKQESKPVTTWMDLEDITLSKTSQSQKGKSWVTSLM